MDRNQWNRNALENRIEQWREQRAQKMAARLQLNSTKPRTISSNVLGYVNYRQPMTVQPGYRQQHGQGPRYNHDDQRWNPSHNYNRYREHHSPHQQYHHVDHRNHGHGHGSYHQQHGPKKGGHFSSQKSLYNDRKSTNKPSNRYSSSCSNINNTAEVVNQNVVCPPEHPQPQASGIVNEDTVPSSSEVNVNTPQVNIEVRENVAAVVEDIEQETEKASDLEEKIEVSSETESDRLQDNTVNEVETIQISECNDIDLPEAQSHVDGCVPTNADAISDISVLEPATNSSDDETTLFVDASSTAAINIENPVETPIDTEYISISPVEVNLTEPQLSATDQKELSEDTVAIEAPESIVPVPDNSAITLECCDINCEIDSKEQEMSATEQVASPESNSDASNETFELELNLSLKPEIDIVENTEEAVDPLKLDTEAVVDSASNQQNEVGIEESCAGNSYHENPGVFPVALLVAGDSDTDAYILRYDNESSESDKDLSKEIELVENKLSNISIVNKEEDATSECFTPMKRERRQVLLDATNILPSSTIKFAVREVRMNDGSEIIVTPVRRSNRLSTLTPVSAHKNVCVQKLEELSPEIRHKMKFVQNPAIDNLP